MLAKLTAKNQLTLPKAATAAVPSSDYFEVETRGGQIILTPVRLQRADAVRSKLAQLGITEADVADAIAWARSAPKSPRSVARPARTTTEGHTAVAAPRRRASRK